MRLTDYTDYTLRVLMFCAVNTDRPVSIAEISSGHGISKNHVMKIVNDLARLGILQTKRGPGGGLRLLKAAKDIRIGEVIRTTESDFHMVECFDTQRNSCTLTPHCKLKRVIANATDAYLAELDKVTLADITETPSAARSSVIAVPVDTIRGSKVKRPNL